MKKNEYKSMKRYQYNATITVNAKNLKEANQIIVEVVNTITKTGVVIVATDKVKELAF